MLHDTIGYTSQVVQLNEVLQCYRQCKFIFFENLLWSCTCCATQKCTAISMFLKFNEIILRYTLTRKWGFLIDCLKWVASKVSSSGPTNKSFKYRLLPLALTNLNFLKCLRKDKTLTLFWKWKVYKVICRKFVFVTHSSNPLNTMQYTYYRKHAVEQKFIRACNNCRELKVLDKSKSIRQDRMRSSKSGKSRWDLRVGTLFPTVC